MIRSTTGGVLRGYRANLMKSFISLNKARTTALTQRNFNSFAEDPVAAAKSFQLRKARMSVESQHAICDDTYRKYQTGWTALDGVSKLIDTENGTQINILKNITHRALNDPTGDARSTLSTAISQISEAIVQNMNQKYGENFVFAGADGQNVPFEIVDNKLYYRGVPVDAAVPDVVADPSSADGAPLAFDAATGTVSATGDTYLKTGTSALISQTEFDQITANDPTATQPQVLMQSDGTTIQRFNEKGEPDPNGEYYLNLEKAETVSKTDYETAQSDVEKLEYLAGERYYVDIGLGFQENERSQLIPSSGFDAALNGIHFIGYGLDEDGDPKNIYSLAQRMKEIAARVGEGDWSDADYEEFHRLVGKLEDASDEFKTQYTDMSAATEKLKNNVELLEDNYYTLVEQTSDLEDANMVESITTFIWAQYCYNAALKVGNSVLSQSLMDYLN